MTPSRSRVFLLCFSFLIVVHALMDIASYPYASSLGPAYAARNPIVGVSDAPLVPRLDLATRDAYRRMLVLTFVLSFPVGLAVGALCATRRATKNREGETPCRKH